VQLRGSEILFDGFELTPELRNLVLLARHLYLKVVPSISETFFSFQDLFISVD